MGVDTKVYLPANVRVYDVTRVIGKLIGLPCRKEPLRGCGGSWSATVDGIRAEGHPNIPGMVTIRAKDLWVTFHYESDHHDGRLLIFRARGERIALARRLVDFFGGWVDYSDCDAKRKDYKRDAKSDALNKPSDEKSWQDLQQRIYDLTPLTPEEIAACEVFAAYKREETT